LRNRIIHDGQRVTREVAAQSFGACAGILGQVRKDLSAHWSTHPWTTVNWATKQLVADGNLDAAHAKITDDSDRFDDEIRSRLDAYRLAIDSRE
jgi:hypothetical protein